PHPHPFPTRRSSDLFQPREQLREPPSFGGRHSQHAKDHAKDDDSNVERLPSFITGGAPAPQVTSPAAHQGYGQNGFDGQGDRFRSEDTRLNSSHQII